MSLRLHVVMILAVVLVFGCAEAIAITEAGDAVARINDWENPAMIGLNKEPAHCTLMPYSNVAQDLEKAHLINELPTRDTTTVNLDYRQMGLGEDDGWTDNSRPHPQYRLPAKPYTYAFRLRPYTPQMGKMSDVARSGPPVNNH